MEYKIRCTGPATAVCVKCGSLLTLAKNNNEGHCGHCGCVVAVEFAEKVVVKEDPPKKKDWVQMSLFNHC